MSWKTRGSVSSAVPRAVHSSEPATRQEKLVSLHVVSATSAVTATWPLSAAPGAGADTVMPAAAAGAVTVRSAL